MSVLGPEQLPPGYATVNPFVAVHGALDLVAFLVEVFDGHENLAARTVMTDDSVIHAEVRIGTATVMVADLRPGWVHRPSLLQVYVSSLEPILERAVERGSTVVTEPTDFYGEQRLARLQDPWGNLWWLFEYGAASTAPSEQPDELPQWRPDADGEPSYVFATIDEAMQRPVEP